MKNLLIRLFAILVLLTGTSFAWGTKTTEEAVPEGPTQVAAEHILVKTPLIIQVKSVPYPSLPLIR